MIHSFTFKNYKTFAGKVEASFQANMNIKRFLCNAFAGKGKRILKTIGIYGPNNSGKTCFILALANLRNVMLNTPHEDLTNSFIDNPITSYSVEYSASGKDYRYEVDYDCRKKEYVSEALYVLSPSPSNPAMVSRRTLAKRNSQGLMLPDLGIKRTQGPELAQLISAQYPIMMAINFGEGTELGQAKADYIAFANSIVTLRMDDPANPAHTIQLMQADPEAAKFIKEFIRNCDLHISDFGYSDDIRSDVDISGVFQNPSLNPEFLKLYSVHGKYRVPSFVFDSVGTLKLVVLSGYIYEALKYGRILLVDEIDSSVHHILTRAIVSLFNNDLNQKAQLVFSTHDLLLLDLRSLFRKDQIYLTDVDPDTGDSCLTHLSDFPANEENGIRGTEEIVQHYLRGKFGAIPTPELFELLEDIVSND